MIGNSTCSLRSCSYLHFHKIERTNSLASVDVHISFHNPTLFSKILSNSTSSKLHKGYFAKEESQIHKSAKGMLLQYSGALVVRDADRNG